MQDLTEKLIASAANRPLCNIGQFDSKEIAALGRAVKRGQLVKRHAPFFGRIGADKTYYAISDEAFDAYQAEQILRSEIAVSMDALARWAA